MKGRTRLSILWLGACVLVGSSTSTALGGYIDYVQSLNPAGYYRLNETIWGTVYDFSGNNRNAQHTGSPSLNQTPGALWPFDSDSAIGANGSVVDISVVAGTLFASGASPFSISLWVKPDGFANWGTPLSYGPASPNQNAFLIAENGTNDGQLAIGTYYNNILYSVGKLIDQQWNHIGITYDGNTLKLFLNGQLDSSLAYTLNTSTPTGGTLGGLYTGGQAFKGLIDEFAYFRYALSDEQMRLLATPVPEPASFVLAVLGSLAIPWISRGFRQRQSRRP